MEILLLVLVVLGFFIGFDRVIGLAICVGVIAAIIALAGAILSGLAGLIAAIIPGLFLIGIAYAVIQVASKK